MSCSLEEIERMRQQLNTLVSELKGNFLHPAVIEISRQLDSLINEYLQTKTVAHAVGDNS
ncbi:MAG: Spo0E like sporulation regulatory protein [Bacilli bacterium]|nr:Spo0E like sporulation regulatory protein [Bacilli bacterium]